MVDGSDGVPDVGEVLDLALEGSVPGEIASHLLEFLGISGVVKEFLDTKSVDGDVDLGSWARERGHG